jgi:hypothetical protein
MINWIYLGQPWLTCKIHGPGHQAAITHRKKIKKKHYKVQFSNKLMLKDKIKKKINKKSSLRQLV